MFPRKLVSVIALIILASSSVISADDSSASNNNNNNNTNTESSRSFKHDCSAEYTLTCLKLDVVSWVDKLSENDKYDLIPGVSLIKENTSVSAGTGELVAELAREFPDDSEARLDAFLLKKVTTYLSSHSLKLTLWDEDMIEEARGKGGGGGLGGGGGKKGGNMGGLIAAALMMKGTLFAIALKAIALIAGKALMAALISVLISAIIGLKALTHHDKHTTYEVISKPIYSSAHTHSVAHEDHGHFGHSSFGRSLDVPLPLGLQPGYQPE